MSMRNKASFALWVLFGINLMNFFDRQLLGAVGETLRNEWQLSDTALGTLGTAFTLLYAAGCWVTKYWGWRPSFYIAAIPGIICAGLALLIKEPRRGASETHAISGAKRQGSPFLLVLSIPTMWWIILSGALHNFNMYAVGSFISPFLQRVYHLDALNAGMISMLTYGLSGVPGLILGGIIGDSIMKRRSNGRLLVAAVSVLID